MVKCADCGKEIPEDHVVHCGMCGAHSAKNAEPPDYVPRAPNSGESEIDLEDMEAEEE